MIEITVQDICDYDLKAILQNNLYTGDVMLNNNGQQYLLIPMTQTKTQDKAQLAQLFDEFRINLPNNFKFDRDEANER